MFDTVYFTEFRTINETVSGDWKVTHEKVTIEGENTEYRAHARHMSLELKAYSLDGKHFGVFHVPSLPRLIYGHNARIIESQADVDLALAVASLLFDQISTPLFGARREYHRVDVAAQFLMNFQTVQMAYSHAKQFRGRKAPCIYPGESILLPLQGQDLKFYHKGKQIGTGRHHGKKLKLKPSLPLELWVDDPQAAKFLRDHGYRAPEPDVVRVEVQFQKKKIVDFLGDGTGKPTHLDIDRGYQALRKVLLAIKVDTFPGVTRKLSTYLAVVNSKNPELYELYLDKCVGERRRKDLVREVNRLMPSLFKEELDWERLLPADRRPSFVSIAMPGQAFIPHDPEKGFDFNTQTPKQDEPPYPDLVKEARRTLREAKLDHT